MYTNFDGHHSGGSPFVYVSVVKKKKQVKSPSIWLICLGQVAVRNQQNL